MTELKERHFGRETMADIISPTLVEKRPRNVLNDESIDKWIVRQINAQQYSYEVRALVNNAYNIPQTHFIDGNSIMVKEDRAPGFKLTKEYFSILSRKQKFQIIFGIAMFLTDMHSMKQPYIGNNEANFVRQKIESLSTTVTKERIATLLGTNKVKMLLAIADEVKQPFQTENFCYAWSQADLSSGNVLYDREREILSIIDFAGTGFTNVYSDLFSSLSINLGITSHIYKQYYELHNKIITIEKPLSDKYRKIRDAHILLRYITRFIRTCQRLPNSVENRHYAPLLNEMQACVNDMIKFRKR
jgi:hypothetical protein